jgi:hypothetical protein
MNKDQITDSDPIMIKGGCIDDADRALNPLGWFYRHNAMHAGTTPMVLDEFGRCARCIKLGFWRQDA